MNTTTYNPLIDYGKVVEEFNQAVARKDSENVARILNEQGGRLQLIANWQKQRELNGAKVRVIQDYTIIKDCSTI